MQPLDEQRTIKGHWRQDGGVDARAGLPFAQPELAVCPDSGSVTARRFMLVKLHLFGVAFWLGVVAVEFLLERSRAASRQQGMAVAQYIRGRSTGFPCWRCRPVCWPCYLVRCWSEGGLSRSICSNRSRHPVGDTVPTSTATIVTPRCPGAHRDASASESRGETQPIKQPCHPAVWWRLPVWPSG